MGVIIGTENFLREIRKIESNIRREEKKMKVVNFHLEDEQYNKLQDLAIKKSVRDRRKVPVVEIVRKMIEDYEGDKDDTN